MQRTTDLQLARYVAAFSSLGAGLIHLAAAPAHWREWVGYGVFFVGIALFQLLWAGAVVLFTRSGMAGLGLAVNLASMALWGASRVWGPPMGPASGVPESVGVAGVLTVLLEAVTVLSALWLLLPRQQTAVLTIGGYRFALVGAVLAMATLTVPGAVAALEHGHGGHGHGHGTHGESETSSEMPQHGDQQDIPAPPPAPSADSNPTPPATEPAHGDDHSGDHSGGHGH